MDSDTDKLIPSFNWNEETKNIKDIEKEILDIIYKINENDNEKVNTLEKENLTQDLKDKMKNVKDLLTKYEVELNNSEIKGDSSEVIKKREDEFILLSKEYERIENIANIDAIGEHNSMDELLDTNERRNFVKGTSIDIPPDEEEEELLQLQEILLDEQDKNLDLLADVIERHKEIGIAINSEIDAQINLIESTEDELEDTQRRLDRTRNRINQAGEYHELSNFLKSNIYNY